MHLLMQFSRKPCLEPIGTRPIGSRNVPRGPGGRCPPWAGGIRRGGGCGVRTMLRYHLAQPVRRDRDEHIQGMPERFGHVFQAVERVDRREDARRDPPAGTPALAAPRREHARPRTQRQQRGQEQPFRRPRHHGIKSLHGRLGGGGPGVRAAGVRGYAGPPPATPAPAPPPAPLPRFISPPPLRSDPPAPHLGPPYPTPHATS